MRVLAIQAQMKEVPPDVRMNMVKGLHRAMDYTKEGSELFNAIVDLGAAAAFASLEERGEENGG